MAAIDEPATRYAIVVPTSALRAAQRVPRRVRQLLRIDIYPVDSGGAVTQGLIITLGQALQRHHSIPETVTVSRRAEQLPCVDRGQHRSYPATASATVRSFMVSLPVVSLAVIVLPRAR